MAGKRVKGQGRRRGLLVRGEKNHCSKRTLVRIVQKKTLPPIPTGIKLKEVQKQTLFPPRRRESPTPQQGLENPEDRRIRRGTRSESQLTFMGAVKAAIGME